MRWSTLLATAALGLVLAAPRPAAAPGADPAPSSGGAVISGQVSLPGSGFRARIELAPLADPYASARARVAGLESPPPVAETWADGAGRFELPAPGSGSWTLRIIAQGHLPLATRVLASSAPVELPKAELVPAEILEVRLSDVAGRPLAGRVAAAALAEHPPTQDTAPGRWSVPLRRAATDVVGRARLPVASGKPLLLLADARGYPRHRLEVVGGSPVEVRLRAGRERILHVVDRRRESVAGVLFFGADEVLPLGLTGEDGRVSVSAFAGEPLELVWRTRGGHRGRHRLAPAAAGEPSVETLVLPIAGRVAAAGSTGTGRVVDEHQDPIAGARVRLTAERLRGGEASPETAETTGEGRFELPGLGAGRYRLTVEARGYARITVPGVEVPAGRDGVDLGTVVLAPGVEICGRVVDPSGLPIAGAEVLEETVWKRPPSLDGGSDAPRSVSDADGFFALDGFAEGERVDLLVRKEGWRTERLPGVRAPSLEPVAVVLAPWARVSGMVVDSTATPVAGARVQVATGPGLGGKASAGAVSDAEGRFVVDEVAPGPLRIRVFADRFPTVELTDLAVEPGGELAGIEVLLESGATIEGRVLGPDGGPVAEVSIAAETAAAGDLGGVDRSGEDGRYRITGVRPGSYTLVAEHSDYPRVVREVTIEEGTHVVDLELAAGGTEVSGRVADGAGRPLGGVALRLARAFPWRRDRRTTSAADGSFVFRAVAEGTCAVVGEKEGYAAGRSRPFTVAGVPVDGLELVLDRGATLSGEVRGVAFGDLSRLRITAYGGLDSRRGTVDPEGRYTVDHLAAGEWTVAAELVGSGRRTEGRVRVEAGVPEARLDLDLGDGYTLSGVASQGGTPLPGATVVLTGPRWRSGRAMTDHRGAFRIEGVPEGSYRLFLHRTAGGTLYSQQVELTGDREIAIELAAGRVTGRVRDSADQSPIAEARVSLERLDDGGGLLLPPQSHSDASGFFRFEAVAGGRWRLIAVKGGYARAERELDVEPEGGAVDGIELEMEATEGIVFEVVLASGQVPARVEVAVLDGDGRRVTNGLYDPTTDGRVRLSSLPEGRWELWITAAESAPSVLSVTSPGPVGRVVLQPGADLEVIVPELEGDPTPAVATLFGPDGWPYPAHGPGRETGSPALREGRLRLRRLPPGAWTIAVTADDGRSWNVSAVLYAGARNEVLLTAR